MHPKKSKSKLALPKHLKHNKNKIIPILLIGIFVGFGVAYAIYRGFYATSNRYTWELVSDQSGWDARSDACSVQFKEKLWLYGGDKTNPNPPKFQLLVRGFLNQPMHDIWNTVDGKSWQKIESESLPKGFACRIIEHKGKLWSFGAGVWSSTDGHNWDKVNQRLPIGNFSASVFKDKFWLMGGNDADIFKREVWSSEDGKDWKQVTNQAPWPARASHSYATTTFDGKLWLIGGQIDTPGRPGEISDTNDVWYTENGREWTEVNTRNSWPGSSGHIVFTHDGYMWVFGGYRDPRSEKINELWRSRDGVKWEMIEVKNEAWYPRDDYAFAIYKDNIWVIGGQKHRDTEPKFGDVWSAELPR